MKNKLLLSVAALTVALSASDLSARSLDTFNEADRKAIGDYSDRVNAAVESLGMSSTDPNKARPLKAEDNFVKQVLSDKEVEAFLVKELKLKAKDSDSEPTRDAITSAFEKKVAEDKSFIATFAEVVANKAAKSGDLQEFLDTKVNELVAKAEADAKAKADLIQNIRSSQQLVTDAKAKLEAAKAVVAAAEAKKSAVNDKTDATAEAKAAAEKAVADAKAELVKIEAEVKKLEAEKAVVDAKAKLDEANAKLETASDADKAAAEKAVADAKAEHKTAEDALAALTAPVVAPVGQADTGNGGDTVEQAPQDGAVNGDDTSKPAAEGQGDQKPASAVQDDDKGLEITNAVKDVPSYDALDEEGKAASTQRAMEVLAGLSESDED